MKTFADFGIALPRNATGPEVATTCPRCSNERKKKSAKPLSVNVEKKTWFCHHCSWTDGIATNEGPAREFHSYGARLRPESRPRELSADAANWLTSRGITEDVIARNKIESGIVYMPQLGERVETIIFPYFRNGELINRKYRTTHGKHFRMETGCELVLYGLDDIEPGKSLIWVEGEIDKLSCEVAGYRNVVSVPNGAPPPKAQRYEAKFRFLEADWEKIDSASVHVLAVDADEAGSRLADELGRRLGIDKCKRVHWPEGRKDANELLVNDGADDLRWFVDNAEPYPTECTIGGDGGTVESENEADDVEIEGNLRPLTLEGEQIMVCIDYLVRQTRFGKKDYLRWREEKHGPVLEQFFPRYERYPVNSKAVQNFIIAMGKRPKRLDRLSLRALVGLRALVYVETVKPTYNDGALKGRQKPEATFYSKVSEILRPLGFVDAQTLQELREDISDR